MGKKSPEKAPEAAPKAPSYTLEQYARRYEVHPGVVASFKVEAGKSGDQLTPRSEKAWEGALRAQSRKKY
jgi:hypothetical protein